MIISPVLAYLLGLFLAPYLSLFPLSCLVGFLSLALVFSWLENRAFFTRTLGCGLYFLILVGGIQSYWVSQGYDPLVSGGLILNQPVDFQGTIAAPVRYTPEGVIILLDVQEWIGQGPSPSARERIRIVWRDPNLSLAFGDHVRV
ncbi:MAG: DUF4131 domain-containing protein, partial [Nitrospirales bacterium]|nr:DUF4131 domain-containing protein [Nitrospirales bacterium]